VGDDARVWQVFHGGQPGALVEHAPGRFRKHTQEAQHEAATLVWLRRHGLPAAEVLEVGADWLITREIQGRTAAERWPHYQREAVVDALVDVTRALHALPVDDCPFDRSLAVTVPAARRAAVTGHIDLDDLDEERACWTATQLLEALEAEVPSMLEVETLTVTHGDWCLPNVLLDPETVTVVGLVDTARAGLADLYTDLALMDRSLRDGQLNAQYGPRYADLYLSRYGSDTDDERRLAFYRLLDEFS
jgi:kanamycin kinase